MSTQTAAITQPTLSTRNGLSWLSYSELDVPDILHGIAVFRRIDLGLEHNRWVEAVSASVSGVLDVKPCRVVIPAQTHGRIVRRVLRDFPGAPAGPCDGLITDEPGTMIGITVADCIPLFAVSPGGHVAGIAHCGWRGIAEGIVEEFLACLDRLTGGDDQARYLIGASIGQCCYEVGRDLLQRFSVDEVQANSVTRGGRVFFDLKSVVVSRLTALGVKPRQISIDKTCTSCQKYILSSYRASGAESGRMLAVVMFTR